MTATERERLRRTISGEASYRAGVVLKCAVCVAVIGLLAMIGASQQDGGDVVSNLSAGVSEVVAP